MFGTSSGNSIAPSGTVNATPAGSRRPPHGPAPAGSTRSAPVRSQNAAAAASTHGGPGRPGLGVPLGWRTVDGAAAVLYRRLRRFLPG
ncbi:hypothetical protein GXW82_01245 [Streptacidiphilus sp. 4-A2]|nr:hypothetical protein [Streptacidiphilus sp. 4-A2]